MCRWISSNKDSGRLSTAADDMSCQVQDKAATRPGYMFSVTRLDCIPTPTAVAPNKLHELLIDTNDPGIFKNTTRW